MENSPAIVSKIDASLPISLVTNVLIGRGSHDQTGNDQTLEDVEIDDPPRAAFSRI